MSRDAATVAFFNRKTSDGSIIDFRKDGAPVGSWQSRSGVVSTIILDPRTGGRGLSAGTNSIVPTDKDGTLSNGATDIGEQNFKFRDLYLSGGAYLGGTAAANKLDDYEEGTWTPVLRGASTAGTPSVGTLVGSYVKIGKLVTLTMRISNLTLSGATGNIQITGIPFTAKTASDNYGTAPFSMTHEINFDGDKNQNWYMGGSYMLGLESQGGGVWSDLAVTNSSGIYINQTITYEEA
jgi:hypothetical protein